MKHYDDIALVAGMIVAALTAVRDPQLLAITLPITAALKFLLAEVQDRKKSA